MNSDSKKSKKNNNTLIILKSILKNLNSFILSPTANNLEALTKNLSEYTQLWIDNTSNKLEVPTDDQFKLITSKAYEPYLQKDNLFNESDASRVFELLGIDNDKFKELTKRQIADIVYMFKSIPPNRQLNKKQLLNRAIHKSTKPLFTIRKIHEDIAEFNEETLKKGAVACIGQKIFIPATILNPIFPSVAKKIKHSAVPNLNFHAFKFRSSRMSLGKTGRPVNRRWLCEDDTNNPASTSLPWNLYRHEIEEILSEKILSDVSYDDPRLENISTRYIPDRDQWEPIGNDDRDYIFHEITLPGERDYINNLKGVKIAIFESDYFKSSSQLLDDQLYKAPTWRDVCIFNDNFITFRSLTNDISHRPSKTNEAREWVMCNNMPEFSVQALRFFKMLLDADIVERINAMINENKSTRDIANKVHLSEAKILRIIERDKLINPESYG